jgi:hypothetical protein
MTFLEVGYCVVAFIALTMLSGALGQWAIRNGIDGPESKAKLFSVTWRLSEVVAALLFLFVLWWPMLHLGYAGGISVKGGGTAFFIAALFTLGFGGLYVAGSLFAAVTVPVGDQRAYFRIMREKANGR